VALIVFARDVQAQQNVREDMLDEKMVNAEEQWRKWEEQRAAQEVKQEEKPPVAPPESLSSTSEKAVEEAKGEENSPVKMKTDEEVLAGVSDNAKGITDLRVEAQRTLANALQAGTLKVAVENALTYRGGEQASCSNEADIEELRHRAMDVLVKAYEQGGLNHVHQNYVTSDEAPTEVVDKARDRAMQTLTNGLKSGVLEMALNQASMEDDEQIRGVKEKAQTCLLSLFESGKLEGAFMKVQGMEEEKTDEMKAKARGVLLSLLQSGEIDRAVKKIEGGPAADDKNVNETREKALRVLLDLVDRDELGRVMKHQCSQPKDPQDCSVTRMLVLDSLL
jgi:hypothetical protein